MRPFIVFLILEIFVAASVGVIFSHVSNHVLAGTITGAIFIVLGFVIVGTGLVSMNVFRSLTFLIACFYLFGISIPMVSSRLMQRDLPFEQVKILGLSGPVFHNIATGVYFVMMTATVIDIFRRWRRRPRRQDAAEKVARPKGIQE